MAEHLPWHTRSTLRRIGQSYPAEGRRLWQRRIVFFALVFGVYWLVTQVRSKAFDPDGLLRFLYLVHDHGYLWVKGVFWTQYFPFSLLWVVPMAALIALLLIEFLTAFGTSWIQRWFLRRLANRPSLHWVFPRRFIRPRFDVSNWRVRDQDPEKIRSRLGGFSLRVVQELSLEAWQGLRDLSDDRTSRAFKKQARRASRYLKLSLGLAPDHPRIVLGALEVFAATGDQAAAALLQRTIDRLSRKAVSPPVEIEALETALDEITNFSGTLTQELRQMGRLRLRADLARLAAMVDGREPVAPSVALAALAVKVAAVAEFCHAPEGRQFFETWVALRLQASEEAGPTAVSFAETLIDFPFWAKRAEDADDRVFPEGAFGAAVAEVRTVHGAPEGFAYDGALP